MLSRLTLVLFINFASVSMTPMIAYKNANFNSAANHFQLTTLSSVLSQDMCACQCYKNSLCITGTFFGINQTCVLFSAHIWQGQLRLISNTFASVFSFPDRIMNTNPDNSPAIIEWLFDGNFNDVYGRYNGSLVTNNGTPWMSPGYAGYGSAIYFSSNIYCVVNHYLDLTTTSFTISAWIWIPFNMTSAHCLHLFLSHCETGYRDKCLQIGTLNDTLLLGFYDDDLLGNTTLKSKLWYHAAYVYDRSTSKQIVYLNGNRDGSQTLSRSYKGNASQITLGAIPLLNWTSCRNSYIDKLTFVSRVKNSAELLDEATLVAYYPFDGIYYDAGPNNINNITHVSTTFDSAGRFDQALLINSTNLSYFQTTGFYYLGQTNYSYSFSLWIYPFANNGTILQVSSPIAWCVPMIGFNETGYLTIQTMGNNGIYAIPPSPKKLSLDVWTHVSMTYSTTNGIRLFVNGLLIGDSNTFYDHVGSGEMNTIIIGTCLQPNTCGVNQTKIVPSQFQGKIDELKIFSRELSIDEISQLMDLP